MTRASLMLAVDEIMVNMAALEQNNQGVPLSDFPLPEASIDGFSEFFKKLVSLLNLLCC